MVQETYLNTTHVSVQYTDYANNALNDANLNTTHVSVQSIYYRYADSLIVPFKYNPCIGSMRWKCCRWCDRVEFKYNPCIGSIQMAVGGIDYGCLFKYNPCIGSIWSKLKIT